VRCRRGIVTLATLWVMASIGTATRGRAEEAAQDSTAASSPLENMARQATQKDTGVAQLPDSLANQSVGIRYMPTYLNQITGDVSSVGMKNSFQTNVLTPFGSTFSFLIAKDERHYRLQNKLDENKQLSATMLHTFNIFTNGSVSFLDSRVFNRSIIPGGATQDYVLNDKSVNAGGSYNRTYLPHSTFLRSIRLDALASGSAVQSERTYKDDQTLAAGGFGGLATNFRGRTIRVNGRGGHRETWDRSETSLATFDGLGSSEDSLSTGLLAQVGDSIMVDARYVYYEGDRTWADQAQGSLGGQQAGVQYVFQETENRSARGLVLSMSARLWDRFRLDVVGNHDSQLYTYAIQQTRYSNTVGDGLKGTVSYTAPWRTTALVTLENSTTLRDFGALSVSSYNDIRKKASLALSHQFRPTFTADLSATTMLTRSEYLDPEANPRDRDQIDTSVNLRFNSTPYTNLTANVSLAYSASDIVNIDASQSENNRTRNLYELRPGFTYVVSEHFSITQIYGIAIEYTDFTYTDEQNFLDRNLTFGNKFDFRPTKKVGFVLDYALNLHDNGSYLPDAVTGQDELTVQGEDRRDRMTLRVDYRVTTPLSVFAEQRYSRFEDRSVLSDTETVTKDGQITVGSRGNYDWGNGKKLTFTLAKVKRFSKYGSEAEKDYWDMRSEFNYPF